ncbi:MAG: selenium cofactor biosynthesis protein YqeC [Candidatus Limivicinus sp.]
MIRAFVGAGGKTTLIHQQAEQYRAEGKSVFVTTSTHMRIEPDTLLTDDPEEIIRQLRRTGYAMAGIPEGKKIRALSPETYRRACAFADVVLVEADGAARKYIKFPNATEPVIYDNVEEIVVVCGLSALGRPLREVAHRPELVMTCLGASEHTIITLEHIAKLVLQGYLRPLGEKYPKIALSMYPAGGSRQERHQLLSMLKEEWP